MLASWVEPCWPFGLVKKHGNGVGKCKNHMKAFSIRGTATDSCEFVVSRRTVHRRASVIARDVQVRTVKTVFPDRHQTCNTCIVVFEAAASTLLVLPIAVAVLAPRAVNSTPPGLHLDYLHHKGYSSSNIYNI